MHHYPVQVPTFRWKTKDTCQIVCRPDALASLSADILNIGPLAIRVGSVETRGGETASFMLTVDVPNHLKVQVEEAVEPYRTRE